MKIRNAEIDDIEEIAIIIKQVSDLHYKARKDKFKLKDIKNIREYVESIVDNEQIKVDVAEENKTICRCNYI